MLYECLRFTCKPIEKRQKKLFADLRSTNLLGHSLNFLLIETQFIYTGHAEELKTLKQKKRKRRKKKLRILSGEYQQLGPKKFLVSY